MAVDRRVTFLIGANVENFRKGLNTAQKSMRKFGRNMERAGRSITRSVTAPIAAIGGAAVKSAGDFESSFADVRKTVDATEQEFGQMQDQLRGLAKEIPTSVNELNRMAGVAGQLGVSNDSIVDFTKTIAMLGDTTDIAGEQAALSLSRFMNVMGTAEEDIDRLGSTIVGLGNNFAAMESEIVDIATSMAPLGNAIGLTEQQVLAFSTTIAASGGEARAASTAFQKTANTMKQAVIEGSAELETFAEVAGMSTSEFQRAFQEDAAGAIQVFLEGLRRVQQEGGSTAAVLEQVGLADQRLIREFGKVIGNLDDLSAARARANEEWQKNTALTEEAQQRYKTLWSRLGILKNRLVDVGITIGNTLIPVVNKLINVSKGVIDWFSNLDESTIRTGAVIAGLAAAIGPLIWGMGQLLTSTAAIIGAIKVLGAVMVTLGKGIISAMLVGSFTKFAAAMRLARIKGLVPMGKAILAGAKAFALMALKVAAAVAVIGGVALLAKSIYDAWDTVDTFFSNLWDEIIIVFAGAIQRITHKMVALFGIFPGVETAVGGLVGELEEMKKAAEGRIEERGVVTFGETVSEVGDKIKDNVSSTVGFVKDQYEGLSDFVSGLMPNLDFGVELPELSKEMQSRFNFAEKLLNTKSGEEEQKPRLSEDTQSAFSFAEDLLNTKPVEEAREKWKGFSEDLANNLVPMISKAAGNAVGSFIEMGTAALVSGKSFGNAFTQVLGSLADLAVRVGKIAIATGLAIEGIKKALQSLNPVAAIAAGIGLIALGSAVKTKLANAAEGDANVTSVNDALIRSDGSIVQFHPNDDILAMQDFSNLNPQPAMSGGGGSQTIHNVVQLDGKTIWENQKEVSRRKSR